MRESTLKNVLLGVAIGDAYGAGLEFQDRDWIRAHVDFSAFVNQRNDIVPVIDDWGNTVNNYNVWDYTDDTEMTIGCVKALISGEALSVGLLLKYWQEEYFWDKKRKGIGRHGHGAMRWLYSGERTIEEIREFQANRPNPGNAPPMRAIPFGFVEPSLIDAYASINAGATHPNPKAIAASIVVARATEYLVVKQGAHQGLIPYCAKFIRSVDREFHERLIAIDQLPSSQMLSDEDYESLCGPQPTIKPWFPEGIKGLPSDAMYTALSALYILKNTQNTYEGFREAIRLGGDVDSIASIVTGILAGRYGLDSLPTYMLENVEGRTMLESLAEVWVRHVNH